MCTHFSYESPRRASSKLPDTYITQLQYVRILYSAFHL